MLIGNHPKHLDLILLIFILLLSLGWLYDATGNYDIGFYFAGVMIFLSGFMLFAIPWIEKKRDAENGNADVENVPPYFHQEGKIIEVDEEVSNDNEDNNNYDDNDDPDDEPMTMKTQNQY